jgi:hypothetical protein
MGFYVAGGNDRRQLLCFLWKGLDDNKKTKSYQKNKILRQSNYIFYNPWICISISWICP